MFSDDFFFFSVLALSVYGAVLKAQIPGETSFPGISSDIQLFLLSDLGVSVDRYEPKREPALHHRHHAPDHPLLQRDGPAQFRALSGMYTWIERITVPSTGEHILGALGVSFL